MAATWGVQMFGLAYVMVFKTAEAAIILQGMAALSTIWAVGLSVLGIYVYKRSEDKKLFTPTQILTDSLISQNESPRVATKDPLPLHTNP
ncbi:MAG: hypothetical protein AAF988_07600 [Pseudomonadota bacterium]